jgi:hypothetical protein
MVHATPAKFLLKLSCVLWWGNSPAHSLMAFARLISASMTSRCPRRWRSLSGKLSALLGEVD